MPRHLRAAVAQLGPIHLADSRASVVKRLIALLREAHAGGAEFVVFPELALTTFFPRWWMTDQAEIDRFFEAQMPSPETQKLFELARELKVGFYLGYAELTEEEGQTRRYNTAILVERDGRIVGRYRKVHLPGHSEHLPDAPFQHLEKRYFNVGNEGFKVWRAYDAVVGMCICNDRRWPETYRVMGLQGVEIVAPTGEIAALAQTEEDEVISVNMDLELGDYLRRTVFAFEKHRRVEHYGLITERTGAKTEV